MRSSRQPSQQFRRRLKSYSESAVNPPSLIRRYKESDVWLWTEVAAVVIGLAFIIPTAIALWIDLEDRQTQRIAQAWESVTRAAPGNSGKGPSLEYLNKQKIRLIGIDLSAESNKSPTYLQGLNLSGADLRKANLSGTDLVLADLSETLLEGANLSGADLSITNLSGAEFFETNLSGADLSGTNLSAAYIEQANLSGADLEGANLSRAYFVEVDLSGVRLSVANLSGTSFINTNLSGADLKLTDLSETHLEGANLSGANFEQANLRGADLSGANLQHARNLSQVMLDGACGDNKTQLQQGFTIKACPKR